MHKDLISVIVPVYNVEKYLKNCVDSIMNQTYKNLEIILVDDGSTDKSGEICDDLAKKDKRIRVIHKKNGGASEARNFGIDCSKGLYIIFVDSDDFVELDMCETLYNSIKKKNADLAICRVVDCYGEIPKIQDNNVKTITYNREQAIKKVLEAEEISVFPVCKIYRRDLFKKVKFDVLKKTAEDAVIMIELINECNIIAYCNATKYYYIHRENSLTTKKFDPKSGYDVIDAYSKNYNIIESMYPKLIDIAKMRLCWAHFIVLDNMVKSNYKIDKKVVQYLRKNFWFILRNPYFTKNRKISMILLMLNVRLYIPVAKKFYVTSRKLNN